MRLRSAQYNDLISWGSEILANGVVPVYGAAAENCYIEDTVKIGGGTKIWPDITIDGEIVIGKNCEIKKGATIIGEGYIGDGSVIGPGNFIENPRIGRGVKMKHHCTISRTEIDDFTNISAFVTVADFDGVEKLWTFIGQKCLVGVGVQIIGGMRIGDEARIYPGSLVDENVPAMALFVNPAPGAIPQKTSAAKILQYRSWYLAGCYLNLKTLIPPGNRAEFLQKAQKKFGDPDSAEFRKWLRTPNLHMGGRIPARCIENIREGKMENDFKCLLQECSHGMPQDPKNPS